MEIINLNIASIKPYEKNNRIHSEAQIKDIAESIQRFGFNQPIVIDENNVILVGHGRALAAEHLQLETVPTVKILGLSENDKRAYRILDNKLQNDSEWNWENLQAELNELGANGYDMAFCGIEELSLLPKDIKEDRPEDFKSYDETIKTDKECPSCGFKWS